jgi:drug/metabolite transporter (DMT)-like permease
MQLLGYFVAIVGILLINYKGITRDYKKANKLFYVGILFAVIYCASTSFYNVYNETLTNTLKTNVDFCFQRLFGSGLYVFVLMSIVFALRAMIGCGLTTKMPNLKNALLLMASISFTSVASTFLFLLSKPEINPVTYASLFNLSPIFIVLLGILVMKEEPNMYIGFGLVIAIFGILFSVFFTEDNKFILSKTSQSAI